MKKLKNQKIEKNRKIEKIEKWKNRKIEKEKIENKYFVNPFSPRPKKTPTRTRASKRNLLNGVDRCVA